MSVVLYALPSHSKKSQNRCPTLPPVIVWVQRPTSIFFLLLLDLSQCFAEPRFCTLVHLVSWLSIPLYRANNKCRLSRQNIMTSWSYYGWWKSFEVEMWFALFVASHCKIYSAVATDWNSVWQESKTWVSQVWIVSYPITPFLDQNIPGWIFRPDQTRTRLGRPDHPCW